MKEGLMPRAHEVLVHNLDKTSQGFKKVRQKYAVRAAVLFAIAFPGCSILDRQEPAPTMTPSPIPSVYQLPSSATFKSTETPTPRPTKTPVPTPEIRPTPTPTIIPTTTPTRRPPTETPRPTPTPTKTPEPTPTPTPTPTLTPEPTRTPIPILTPTPTPPEVQKTYVKPGQKLVELAQRIENPLNFPILRSLDLDFQISKGDLLRNERKSVKTEFRIPLDSEKSISEGTVFNVPPGGMWIRIIVDVPPGASPGCFRDIISSLKTREPGTKKGEIKRESLAKHVCVEETLMTHFVNHYYDEKNNRVISQMLVINSAPVGQMAKLEIANCSSKIAEKIVFDGSKRIFTDQSQAIPDNTQRSYTVYFTLLAGEKASFPFNCTVKPLRDFNK